MGETVTSVAGTGAVLAYDRPPFGLSSRPTNWKVCRREHKKRLAGVGGGRLTIRPSEPRRDLPD
eukprot:3399618-Pyramimonas_sp.AAC.1